MNKDITSVFSLMHRMGMINENAYTTMANESRVVSLNEAMTIDKATQTFNQITPEAIQQLIAMDPTYKGGNNVGKLFVWIANAYLREPSMIERPDEVKELLTIFKDNQNRFDTQADIKKFQNITQLKQFLAQQGMLNQEEGDEIANSIDNAEVRNGTKVVHNGQNWLIIVPTNYPAARHWGANTTWCTAADNDGSFYNRYLQNYGGQYYILINKEDNEDKYQFHFESNQFMNADDEQIGGGVYDLPGFSELDDFFTEQVGDDWASRVEAQGEDENHDFEFVRDIGHHCYLWQYGPTGEYTLTYEEYAPNPNDDSIYFSDVDDFNGHDIARVVMANNNDGNEGKIAYYSDGDRELISVNGVTYFDQGDAFSVDDEVVQVTSYEYGTTLIDGYGSNVLGDDFFDEIDFCWNKYYGYDTGNIIVTSGEYQNICDYDGNWHFTEQWPDYVGYDSWHDWFVASFDEKFVLVDKNDRDVKGYLNDEEIDVFDYAFFPNETSSNDLIAYVRVGEQWYTINGDWELTPTKLPEKYNRKR